MRVVVADIQNYGYLGYHLESINQIKVFGNMQLAEEWIGSYYQSSKEIFREPRNSNYTYHCTTANQEIEYVTLYDREIIES